MAQIMYKNPDITTTYTGRNGDGKCIGIIVQDRITAGGEKAGVILSPINSKGNQANCYINIPPEDVKAVAIALLNSIGEITFQLGAPVPAFPESKPSEFFYSLNMSGRSAFHKTTIECEPEFEDPDSVVSDAVKQGIIDRDDAMEIVCVARIEEDDYNRAMGIRSPYVIDGTYSSEWSDGETITTPATLNTKTGKLDVEMSDDDGDHGSLEREYFTDTNDKEYEVCSCCHEYITKTEMVDDKVGNGQHEETRCMGDCE